MNHLLSGDAEIFYEILGSGPPVVLLHPFPVDHEFWKPAAQALLPRYQVVLPDLRAHGESGAGDGAVTMEKHSADLARVLDQEGIGRAAFAGVSIGGYVLFEFWRKYRGRVAALALCNTRAQSDAPLERAKRLQSANDILHRGTEPFFEGMRLKVMGPTTHRTRPDLVHGAMAMMRKMSPEDVSQVQQGMAKRPDSVETLRSINVPALIVTGDEDNMTGLPDAELMRRHIAGSSLQVVPRAAHYSPWEQPEEVGRLLRQFIDGVYGV